MVARPWESNPRPPALQSSALPTELILFFLSIAGLDCEIDISKSIQNVRAQRSGMVQTEVGLSSSQRSLTL